MDWILAISMLLIGLACGAGLMLWLTGGPIVAQHPDEQTELPSLRGEDDSDPGYGFVSGRYPLH